VCLEFLAETGARWG